MKFYHLVRPFLVLLFLPIFNSCSSDSNTSQLHVSSDFESGSIGEVEVRSNSEIVLSLRNDNDNSDLPSVWRNWWYIRIDNFKRNSPVTIRIRNRGFSNFYLPVYSYDGESWQRLPEEAVQLSDACRQGATNCVLELNTQFDSDTVYLARYYPYTTARLEAFIEQISSNPFVRVETIGRSPVSNYPITLLTITDADTSPSLKFPVFLHARTHPAETGGSFFIEGAIERILNDFSDDPVLAQHYIFYVVPMHNPDGVIAGNYRTNLESINLETTWFFDHSEVANLNLDAPVENQLLQSAMRQAFSEYSGAAPFMAINLHSANTPESTPAFAFPHFGPGMEFSAQEQSLWLAQTYFISLLNDEYAGEFAPAGEAGEEFLEFFFPETWWWHFAADSVLAMTIETSYAKAGFSYWITEQEIRELGSAFISAAYRFYEPNNRSRSLVRSAESYDYSLSEIQLKQ